MLPRSIDCNGLIFMDNMTWKVMLIKKDEYRYRGTKKIYKGGVKRGIPSAARTIFWKMVFLSPKKYIYFKLGFKFWSFMKKMTSFQWFGYQIRINVTKLSIFSPLRRDYSPLSPFLGCATAFNGEKIECFVTFTLNLLLKSLTAHHFLHETSRFDFF